MSSANSTAINMQIDDKKIYVAAFGGGTNSSAMLVRWVKENKPLHLVLFADTGAERPETYCHVEKFSRWLARHGYPEIFTVKYTTKNGDVLTLEKRCLNKKMLPSLAYGYKKCSLKFKVAPQDKYINNWELAKEAWRNGDKVVKLIGYDYGEEHRVLNAITKKKENPDAKYEYIYPLYDWKINRTGCIKILKAAGIRKPGKSSCFFCPAMKKREISEMKHKYPQLMQRAINLEKNAKHNLTDIVGLGRNWSWENFIKQGDLFPELYPEARDIEICCDCYDG